jgi:hypothetical protein
LEAVFSPESMPRVMDLEETEASNDYDGEDQQQFNQPTD